MTKRGLIKALRSKNLLSRGTRLMEQAEYQDALRCLEHAADLNPESPEILCTLGRCRVLCGRNRDAIDAFHAAAELSDQPSYACEWGRACLENKDATTARKAFQRALRREATHEPSLVGLGDALCMLGRLEAAVEVLKTALELNTESATAHNAMGFVRLARKEADDAANHFRKAIRIEPEMASAYQGLARALEILGRKQEALTALERAAQLAPFSSELQVELGDIYTQRERWRNAQAAYQRAVNLNPNDKTTKAKLVEAESHSGDNGINIVRRIGGRPRVLSANETRNLPNQESLSASPLNQEDKKEQTDINVSPSNTPDPVQLLEQGRTYYYAGRYQEALDLWTVVAGMMPDNPAPHNNMGAALAALGRHAEALEACRYALMLQPDYHVARATLCEIYAEMGHHDAFLKEYDELKKHDPELAKQLNDT